MCVEYAQLHREAFLAEETIRYGGRSLQYVSRKQSLMADEISQIFWSQNQKVSPPYCMVTGEPLQVPELWRDTVGSGFRKTGQATMYRVTWKKGRRSQR